MTGLKNKAPPFLSASKHPFFNFSFLPVGCIRKYIFPLSQWIRNCLALRGVPISFLTAYALFYVRWTYVTKENCVNISRNSCVASRDVGTLGVGRGVG